MVKDNLIVNSDLDKANMLNSFFSSCFNSLHSPIGNRTSLGVNSDLMDIDCTVEEVIHLLSNLQVGKASGPDGVSSRMLRSTASSIAPSITRLFNFSLQSGQLPTQWKTSLIVPIPKSSNPSDPGNYRPISLTCILCKVLEKHIRQLMEDHLNETGQLSSNQWGFRSKRSTVSALVSVTYDWISVLENGDEVGAVFLDYSKAFDSVPHMPLITKLQKMCFNPLIVEWITDYLRQRVQYVVVNGKSSNVTAVSSGVPQGSVLGPILFIIYVNDLLNIDVRTGNKIHLYADDVLLYKTISSSSDYEDLQRSIDCVSTWSYENFLNLNQTKCKFMLISRKRNPVLCLKPLQLNGVVLDSVQSFKYLGVMLTSDMSWSTHVSMVCSRARKILGVIYRQFYANATSAVLLQLYLAMVRPHVEYAAAVWSPHLKKDIALIEGVQKFALRMVFGAWGASYHHLLFPSNQLTLEDRRLVMKLSVLYQILDGSWHFQPGIFVHDESLRHHSLNERTLVEPFCRTNCFRFSFVPSSIAVWNNLQDIIVSADSLQLFRCRLRQLIYVHT